MFVNLKVSSSIYYYFFNLDYDAKNITVWTRDHNWRREDGEMSHAVCSKTEHPEYDRNTRHDKDIAVLHLCQPLMFTESKSLLSANLDYLNLY